MTEVYSENGHRTTDEAERWEYSGEELEAQRAARDAVMELPLFPHFERSLVGAFGPTAATFMMRDFRYWFSRPKIQHRWVVYIKADQWRERMGLNRKQVNKGRAQLRAAGVLEEKMGPYKRIHYRVDWVRLAELVGLSIPLKGGQKDEDEDETLLPPYRGSESIDTPKGGSESIDTPPQRATDDQKPRTYGENGQQNGAKTPKQGGQTNTGSYAGEYLQDIPLAEGAPDATRRSAPNQERNRSTEGKTTEEPTQREPRGPGAGDAPAQEAGGAPLEDHVPPPPVQKVPEPPRLDQRRIGQLYRLMDPLPEDGGNPVSNFTRRHLEGRSDANGDPFTVERIAEKAREALGGREPLAAYVAGVERVLPSVERPPQPSTAEQREEVAV